MKSLKLAILGIGFFTTVASSAVLTGFGDWSTSGYGENNTTCGTWNECLGVDTIGNASTSNGNNGTVASGVGNGTNNGLYNIYYLTTLVNLLDKHPDFVGVFNVNSILPFMNGLQVINELINNNKGNIVPVLNVDILTGNGTGYYENSDKTLALKKNSTSNPSYRYFYNYVNTRNTGSGYIFYYNACYYNLDDNLAYLGRGCSTTSYFYDRRYIYNTATRGIPARIYNLNVIDSGFSVGDIVSVQPVYAEGLSNSIISFICLTHIKKDTTTGVYNISPTCKSVTSGKLSLIDVFYIGGNLFAYGYSNGVKKIPLTCSNGVCTIGTASSISVNNTTTTSVPSDLSYGLIKDLVDKYSYCVSGKCYSIDSNTGSITETDIFPVLSTIGNGISNSTITQAISPVNNVCEYRIEYSGYTFLFRSKFYDTNLNKCYTLSSIKRLDKDTFKVGNRIYYSTLIYFNELASPIFAIGYSILENGNSVYQMEGYYSGNNSSPVQVGHKFLFYSTSDQKYYGLIGQNLVIDLGNPNVSEFPYEVYIK